MHKIDIRVPVQGRQEYELGVISVPRILAGSKIEMWFKQFVFNINVWVAGFRFEG